MKKSLLFILVLLQFSHFVSAQSNPVALRPDVQITALKSAPNFCAGIAMDPVLQKLCYIRLNGEVYLMNYPGGSPVTDSLMFTVADHGITLLKSMMFRDSALFLIGNNHIDTTLTTGIIVRGDLLPNGSRTWITVAETEPYQLGNTFFDHGFSGLCLNLSGDSIYFNSGSRTEHGEAQENSGLYPGVREVPVTSAIFRIPATTTGLQLFNDSTLLSPYLYADGTRNTFKMAVNARGHLIGAENSGDRDDPDELNLLQEGRHYGFPWTMGGNLTPQQFPGYDPAVDFMINQAHGSFQNGYFYNDPSYPPLPTGVVLQEAIRNNGPDGDKFRDTISGQLSDASDLGISTGTFTPHRSVLGLVFDNDSLLIPDLKGHGFLFGNSAGGDSLGNVPGGGLGTLLESGEDMMDLAFVFDSLTSDYSLMCTKVIEGFTRPVDACISGNKIYVMEYGRPGATATIYEITMPLDFSGISTQNPATVFNVFPEANNTVMLQFTALDSKADLRIIDLSGRTICQKHLKSLPLKQTAEHKFTLPGNGYYIAELVQSGSSTKKTFILSGK